MIGRGAQAIAVFGFSLRGASAGGRGGGVVRFFFLPGCEGAAFCGDGGEGLSAGAPTRKSATSRSRMW